MQAHEVQLQRLKQALNVDSDTALSQVLEVSQGSVSGAKKRGQIPHSWFFQVAEKTGCSVDWLFRGTGEMHLAQDSEIPNEQGTTDTPSHEGSALCERCQRLEKRLELVEDERRGASEKLVEALQANLALLTELGEQRVTNLKLAQQLDTARRMCSDYEAAIKAAGVTSPIFGEKPITQLNDCK